MPFLVNKLSKYIYPPMILSCTRKTREIILQPYKTQIVLVKPGGKINNNIHVWVVVLMCNVMIHCGML